MKKLFAAVIIFTALSVINGFSQTPWWYESAAQLRAKFPEKEINLSKEKLSLPLAFNGNLPYMNRPIDQKNQGCCVAAAGASLISALKAQEKGWDPKIDEHALSPAFPYNRCLSPWGPGIAPSTFFNLVATEGCAMRSDMPFDASDDTTKPSLPVRYKALEWRCDDWGYFFDLTTAKAKLLEAPLMAFINNPTSSHSICLVGYNDTITVGGKKGAFYYLNSIGESWGENGYGWRAYADIDTVFYFAKNRTSVYPELVCKIESNLSRGHMYMLHGDDKFVDYSFVKGGDTLKSFTYLPEEEDFLLALDYTSEASGADKLIVTGEYTYWSNWNSPMPVNMEMYDFETLSPDGYTSPLTFTSARKDSVIDSIVVGSYVSRNYYSKFVAIASLTPVAVPEFGMSQAPELKISPNPMVSQTTFSFSLEETGEINLTVYDLNGKRLSTLLNGRFSMGDQKINWAPNLPPGMYFAKLSVDKKITTKKIMVVK